MSAFQLDDGAVQSESDTQQLPAPGASGQLRTLTAVSVWPARPAALMTTPYALDCADRGLLSQTATGCDHSS